MKSAGVSAGRLQAPAATTRTSLSHFVVEYLLVLPMGAAIALIWVNAHAESYYPFTYSIAFFVNEIALAFFFGLVTKEIVEATAPGGLFHPPRRVALPLVAVIGGILASALIYWMMLRLVDEPMLGPGWPVLFAADLAFGYAVARAIFGRHPAVMFLLLTGIAANAFGIAALALFYPARDANPAMAAVLMAAALTAAGVLRTLRVKTFWPYVTIGGTLSWFALFAGGFHAALALVPIVAFLPHAARDPGFFIDAPPGARDALDRFELWCRAPAQVSLFLFGLVNAGVRFRAVEGGQWAAPVALLAGRPLGMLAVVAFAAVAGMHLPHRLGWRELIVVGIASGIGFTLALFFASSVFPAGQLLGETKIGALLSLAGVPLAFAAARLLKVGRYAR